MVGFEMFCERCGKRYGNGEAPNSTSLPLSKRLLKVVGVSASAPAAPADEPLLRFCLACRGYSCPDCWNDTAGFCQTCVPLPEPVVEQPLVNIPTLETPAPAAPAPQMSFAPVDDEMPPYLAMLVAQDQTQEPEAPQVDPLADFAAEPVVDVEPETASQPVLSSDPDAEDTPVQADAVEVVAEIAEIPEGERMVAAEPVVAAEAVVAAEDLTATETPALDERPIELIFQDEELTLEPEPEAGWDWAFVAESETAPRAAEPVIEPVAASDDAADAVETGALIDAPVIPAQPQVLPPPVYRPLPPLGPIMPPPPAAASARPTIDFDILEPPPAFVIAPPQAQALMRPQLPAGLFDGPGPQIRPCPKCDLPVSAKARFCRRCGSSQD
jgi:hypothetical protein